MDLKIVTMVANLWLIPTLLFFYFKNAKKVKVPIVVALLAFYVRDFFVSEDFAEFAHINFISFFIAISILMIYAITEFQKSKVGIAEYLSFFIIYGFSFFLFSSLSEMVPTVLPNHQIMAYMYLLILVLFLSIGFTVYFLKSHKASLWLMLFASAITFSETCFFLKVFVVEDISVAIFYPLFHVFAYLSIVMYAFNRRSTDKLPYF